MRSLLAVTTVLAIVVAACGGPVATPTSSVLRPASAASPANGSAPRATPAPAAAPASGSAMAPSPVPTVAARPDGQLPTLGLRTIAVPAASLRTMSGDAALATWGSRAYSVDEPPRSGHASLVVADLASGTTTRTPIPLLEGETTVPPDGLWDPATIVAVDAHWLVVVAWTRLGPTGGLPSVPCTGHEEQPVAWRLLVAPLDHATGQPTSVLRVFDHGTNTHPFALPGQGQGCSGPRTPRVSLSGDDIAYTVEESGAATTFATSIEVRVLPSGSPVRLVQRPQEVLFVALSGDTLAFTESQSLSPATADPRWSVGLSTAAHPAPTAIVAGTMDPGYVAPPIVGLDGDLLAWQLLNHPEEGVWVERLGSPAVQVVPARLTCWLGGVTAGWVGMGCYPTGYQTDSFMPYQPVAWSAAAGLRQLVGLPQLVAGSAPSLGGGWLSADGGSPIEATGTLFGLPLIGLSAGP